MSDKAASPTTEAKAIVDVAALQARLAEMETDRNHWHAEALRIDGHYDRLVERYNQVFEIIRALDVRQAERLLATLPTYQEKDRTALATYIARYKAFFGDEQPKPG